MSLKTPVRLLRALLPFALLAATGSVAAQDCAVYDDATCGNQLYTAEAPQLQRWCEQGTMAACSGLLREWTSEARSADTRPQNDDPVLQEPAVCKQADPAFDEQACEEAAKAALSKAMGMALVGIFDQRQIVLPAARRQTLQQLCLAHPEGEFCREVAQAQWTADSYDTALVALKAGCAGGDESACELHAPLQSLGTAPRPLPATAVPCGEYRSEGGMLDTLEFGDGGLVGFGLGDHARARLEDGAIRIRHDKGGDFVFKVLAGGHLVGMDDWTQMRVYRRVGGAAQCSPAVVFKAVPLPQDCPGATAEGAAEACCAAGRLQGCNVLGNQLALDEQWPQAATHYQTVCRAGVREGCENLVSAQDSSAEVDARAALEHLCKADASGTAVACDVLATTNWDMIAMGRMLQEAADDVAEPEAPARTRNHKR